MHRGNACRECGRETTRSKLKGLCYDCAQGCRHEFWEVGRARISSGAVQVKSRCLRCKDMLGTHPSSDFDLDALPWLYDRPSPASCERCGSTDGVELHHWAPREFFGDEADAWPTGWLCTACHARWHDAMRR